jgi:hypothetical protein
LKTWLQNHVTWLRETCDSCQCQGGRWPWEMLLEMEKVWCASAENFNQGTDTPAKSVVGRSPTFSGEEQVLLPKGHGGNKTPIDSMAAIVLGLQSLTLGCCIVC